MFQKLICFVILMMVNFGENTPVAVARHLTPTDLVTASSHHYAHPGRVQIKVYRGPEHDHHASHGYWGRGLLMKNIDVTISSLVNALTNMNLQLILASIYFAFIYVMQHCEAHKHDFGEEKTLYPDLVSAANNHHHGHGRVQIKVYRGPSEGHEHFAQHGYWVKQPADYHHHH